MAIKPRKSLKEKVPLADWTIRFLIYGEILEGVPETDKLFAFRIKYDAKMQKKFWNEVKVDLLKKFTKSYPCCRPWAWWKFDAPKESLEGWEEYKGFNTAQRRRLGGIGTPSYEVLNTGTYFFKGIPTSWVDAWQADYYNGKAKDIHGNPIGAEYENGDFSGVPIDSPVFESEASYLQRHGFLTKAEKKHLEKNPALFEPETIKNEI